MPLEGYAQTLPELEFCLCRHPYDKAATYSAIALQDPSENVIWLGFRVEIPPEKVFGALGMVLKGAQLKKYLNSLVIPLPLCHIRRQNPKGIKRVQAFEIWHISQRNHFLPSCHVRVVRFYVNLLLPSFFPSFVALLVFFNCEPHVSSVHC